MNEVLSLGTDWFLLATFLGLKIKRRVFNDALDPAGELLQQMRVVIKDKTVKHAAIIGLV